MKKHKINKERQEKTKTIVCVGESRKLQAIDPARQKIKQIAGDKKFDRPSRRKKL